MFSTKASQTRAARSSDSSELLGCWCLFPSRIGQCVPLTHADPAGSIPRLLLTAIAPCRRPGEATSSEPCSKREALARGGLPRNLDLGAAEAEMPSGAPCSPRVTSRGWPCPALEPALVS